MRQPDWKQQFQRLTPLDRITYRAPYTEERLQAARSECDPLADAVLADLYQTEKVRNPHDMLSLVRERAAAHGGHYKAFLHEANHIPHWVNFEKMRTGQRLIAAYGPLMGLSLLTGSLVGGYVFYKASKVTQFTGRLAMPGDISRRIVETGALVFYMSRPEEVRPGGKAHDTLMRVRLLHAAIRIWIRESGRWRADWDEPINQEDLAITFSEFSFLNMRNLLRMGVRLSDEEIDSHFHLWRYAGYVLGINETWLPRSFEQEIAQFLPMLKHQAKPKQGLLGARAILDEVADQGPQFIPQPVRREFFYQVTAHLVGNDLMEGLRIVRLPGYRGLTLLRAVGAGMSLVHRIPAGERLLHDYGQRLFQRQLELAHKERAIGYQVKLHDPEAVKRAHENCA